MAPVHVDDLEVDTNEFHRANGEPFTGEVIETDSVGAVVERYSVSQGWEDGPQRAWHSNGQPKFEGRSRCKVPTGTSRWWNENGDLVEERDFDDRGRLVGVRQWDENGVLILDDPQADPL